MKSLLIKTKIFCLTIVALNQETIFALDTFLVVYWRMAKLNLKTRESKASVSSSPKKTEDKPATSVGSSFSGTKPGSKLAGKTGKQITALDNDKPTSSLHSFSKFAASGAGNSSVKSPSATLGSKASESKPMRFSDRYAGEEEGGNSLLKVVAFIVVIIAIGLGVIYFIQANLVGDANGDGSTGQSSSATTTAITEPGLYLSTILQPDADSEGTAPNSLYQQDSATLGSLANENENALVDEMIYEAYDSFTRVVFRLTNVEDGFPGTTIELDSDDNIVVTFSGVSTERDALLEAISPTVGNILEIDAVETEDGDLVFTLQPSEASEYYVSLNEAGDMLELDIKTETQLTQVSNTSSSTSSSTTSSSSSSKSSSSSSKTSSASTSSATSSVESGDNSLTNTRSQGQQSIVIANNSSDVTMTGIYYQDHGPRFQFDWVFKGTSESKLPDVNAEIIQENGNFYIELVFKNMFYDQFYGTGKTSENFSNVNLEFSNLKKVTLVERDGQTSTYRALLGFRGDYRLTATEIDQEHDRRVVRLEVFD